MWVLLKHYKWVALNSLNSIKVWAKIWCPQSGGLCLPSWRCLHDTASTISHWMELCSSRGFEIPKREVNSVGPFEVFDAGLQWPALWSFSSLLAGDLFVKLVFSPSAGQYPNYDGPSSLFHSLSLCVRCRITPDLSPAWFVSPLWSKEYWNARVLSLKFSANCTFNEYESFLLMDCSHEVGSFTLY